MFDLKFYNTLAKTEKYIEEQKTKSFTRATIHKRTTKKGSNNSFWMDRINEMPNEVVRECMLLMYNQKGEAGLHDISKDLHKLTALKEQK